MHSHLETKKSRKKANKGNLLGIVKVKRMHNVGGKRKDKLFDAASSKYGYSYKWLWPQSIFVLCAWVFFEGVLCFYLKYHISIESASFRILILNFLLFSFCYSLPLICSSVHDGILSDNPHLVLLYYLSQLFLRELFKSYRLIQVVPMDMSGYYGK